VKRLRIVIIAVLSIMMSGPSAFVGLCQTVSTESTSEHIDKVKKFTEVTLVKYSLITIEVEKIVRQCEEILHLLGQLSDLMSRGTKVWRLLKLTWDLIECLLRRFE
jgi:hypothetical protein